MRMTSAPWTKVSVAIGPTELTAPAKVWPAPHTTRVTSFNHKVGIVARDRIREETGALPETSCFVVCICGFVQPGGAG